MTEKSRKFFHTLISTAELAENLQRPDVKILDASYVMPGTGKTPLQEFAESHIPGARFFDIEDISDHGSTLPHMLPSAEQFERQVRALGINKDDQIVVYARFSLAMAAARAWWMFRAMGHNNIAVLDGGLLKWAVLEKREIESGYPPPPSSGDFRAKAGALPVWTMAEVEQNLNACTHLLVDARNAQRFSGEVAEPRPGMKSGHIPASINIPFTEFLEAQTQCFKPPAAIRAVLESNGIDPDRDRLVSSCGSGVTSCVLILAMAMLGKNAVANYDGSWSEWGQKQPEHLIARGSAADSAKKAANLAEKKGDTHDGQERKEPANAPRPRRP